jgi:hypothetical protein
LKETKSCHQEERALCSTSAISLIEVGLLTIVSQSCADLSNMAAQQLLQSSEELASASEGQVPNLRSTVGAFISAALAISRIPAEKLLDNLLKEFLKQESNENGHGPSRGQSGSVESLAVVSTFVSAAMHLLEKEGEVDSRCGQCQWFVFRSAKAANCLEGAYQAHNSGDQ